MRDIEALKKHLNHMSHELAEVKKLIIDVGSGKQRSDRAWDDLMSASEEISNLWTDISVVEEIRSQREKT